jgi:type IV secretion system protein VirD4
LISKITISAGYGFRMAIVMQDLAQLDELYGKNARITTVSGSQIKLFIQINDLETSEFVSEMLGETTQVYETPIQRPGQGIFAPRVWAPHYTPRPLRSPLELREMSARLSILMVKNSPSFELTKIRHYLDKPYRGYFERAKGSPPVLPRLRAWQDEPLQGAISPAPEQQEAQEVPTTRSRKPTTRRQPQRAAAKTKAGPVARDDVAPLALTQRAPGAAAAESQPRRLLSLGAQPPAPPGESCDVREILAAATEEQDEGFKAMSAVLREGQGSKVRQAADTLDALHRSFGEDQK